jgi:Mu-like prophage I protein
VLWPIPPADTLPGMKAFELFKVGKHTSASGAVIEFSDEDLKKAVAAYDPSVSEAPLVIGHPKDTAPSYGWVKGLSFADGSVTADPEQVDPEFSEIVQAGRYKKRSASWYTPGSANHPLKGTDKHDTYYLRHVAFLGAVPPAIKGLKEVAFSDAEEGVVEFADESRWAMGSLATILRGIREWLIADKGIEQANQLIPSYALTDIENAARPPSPPASTVAYSEDSTTMKTVEQLQAELDAANASNASLQTQVATLQTKVSQVADFAERDTSLKAREDALAAKEAAMDRASVEARVAKAIQEGRVLPKMKNSVVSFAMSLADKEATLDFGEGTDAKKVTQRDAYLLGVESGPKLVEFGELSAGSSVTPQSLDPQAVANKARAIVDQREKDGAPEISFTEACELATKELAG